MMNSLIGKSFTYKGHNVLILDAIIENIDRWDIYILLVTNFMEFRFCIRDYYMYLNMKSINQVEISRAKVLLVEVFNKISKFDGFSGYMQNETDSGNRFEIVELRI